MKKPTKQTWIIDGIGLLVFALFLSADLLTKAWAVETNPSFAIIPKVLKLTLIYNSGMAFGIFSDSRTAMIVVIAITVLIMIAVAVAFFLLPPEKRFLKILLCVIEAGAIGNLVDRIMMLAGVLPGVRDFVDVSFFGFGVCNLADFYVSFGGVILLIYFFFFGSDPLFPIGKKRKQKAEEAKKQSGDESPKDDG